MTITIEQSKHITDDELEKDIRLTGLELEAYQKIADGFMVLAGMPENIESGSASTLHMEYRKYKDFEIRCANFLRELHELKAARTKAADVV